MFRTHHTTFSILLKPYLVSPHESKFRTPQHLRSCESRRHFVRSCWRRFCDVVLFRDAEIGERVFMFIEHNIPYDAPPLTYFDCTPPTAIKAEAITCKI